jgi:hypothetical protein
MTIMTVIVSVPHRPVKQKLLGGPMVDERAFYAVNGDLPKGAGGRGSEGPRVLMIGCGADTPLYVAQVMFLGGTVEFVDNNAQWAKTCVALGGTDTHVVEYTGTPADHIKKWTEAATPFGGTRPEYHANEAFDLPAKLRTAVTDQERRFDVIVVDGPAMVNSRSQPLYLAVRTARSYAKHHFTHIFLHDASRPNEMAIANTIIGHDPVEYMGNTLPRKGLKHWRLEGRDWAFEF